MDELATVELEHILKDELIKKPQFDDALSYDGEDINYFNSGIKADGTFHFERSGVRAQIEIIIDYIDSSISITRQVKETSLSYYNLKYLTL